MFLSHWLGKHIFLPSQKAYFFGRLICIGCQADYICDRDPESPLDFDDFFGGLDTIHHGHVEIHDYQLVELVSAPDRTFVVSNVRLVHLEGLQTIFSSIYLENALV